MKMKARRLFQMSVSICQSAWYNIPEDFNSQQHRSEKLNLAKTLTVITVR